MNLSRVLRGVAAALIIGGSIAATPGTAAAMEHGGWLGPVRCATPHPFAGGACIVVQPGMGAYDPGYQYDAHRRIAQ